MDTFVSCGPHLKKTMGKESHALDRCADVVEALTYYGHREKLRLVGKEDALEELNHAALRIAREVAEETGSLLAGNICNCAVIHLACLAGASAYPFRSPLVQPTCGRAGTRRPKSLRRYGLSPTIPSCNHLIALPRVLVHHDRW